MSLFNKGEVVKVVSMEDLEDYEHYFNKSNVISTEAIQDFFSILKDKLVNNFKSITTDVEKSAFDATRSKYETLSVIKRINMAEVAEEMIVVPDGFKGLFSNYSKSLLKANQELLPEVITLLDHAKMSVGLFINEYTEDGVMNVYGTSQAKKTNKLIETHKKEVSAYFKGSKQVARVRDVVKALNEVEPLFDISIQIGSSLKHNDIKQLDRLASEVSDMVDTLLEINTESGILLRNNTAKKELLEVLNISARAVEYIGYLFSNSVLFFGSVNRLSEVIIVVGNQK